MKISTFSDDKVITIYFNFRIYDGLGEKINRSLGAARHEWRGGGLFSGNDSCR